MGKYKVIESQETGWLTVLDPSGHLVISNLIGLDLAKVWIQRHRARKLLSVVTPGTVIYEEDE